MNDEKRRGARRRADIPPDILGKLNRGELETASLAEGLAIDFRKLLRCAVPELSGGHVKKILPTDGVVQRMATAGYLLYQYGGLEQFETLLTHPSDTVRGWAAYLLASLPELSLEEQLERIRPLADDNHFSVREWAWIAIRPSVAANLDEAVELLTPWTTEESPNLRRFASEITRPRGVWCAHIKELKENPKRGIPLLDPLSSDPHRYVQDSVANWLNDAGKSNPGWVVKVCRRWQRTSRSKATARICKRACRNITDD